jgi:hypothetical protein
VGRERRKILNTARLSGRRYDQFMDHRVLKTGLWINSIRPQRHPPPLDCAPCFQREPAGAYMVFGGRGGGEEAMSDTKS